MMVTGQMTGQMDTGLIIMLTAQFMSASGRMTYRTVRDSKSGSTGAPISALMFQAKSKEWVFINGVTVLNMPGSGKKIK